MRRLAGVVALLVAGWGPAAAAQPQIESVTFMLVRTTSGASSFDLDVSAYLPNGAAFVGEADLLVRGGRVVRVDGGVLQSENVRTAGAGVGPWHVRTCDLTACSSDVGFIGYGTSFSSRMSEGDVNVVMVVARGSSVRYRFTGHGWRLLPVSFRYRFVETATSAPAYLSVGPYGAAVSGGARTSGARAGSVALANPPCSIATTGAVSRGVGQVRLVGGITTPTFTCPVDRVPLAAFARGATTWSLEGPAIGDSTNAKAALFVADVPTRMPPAAP